MAAAGGAALFALVVAIACILCTPPVRDDTQTYNSEAGDTISLLQSAVSWSRIAEVSPTLQVDRGALPSETETAPVPTPEHLATIAWRRKAMLEGLAKGNDAHTAAARQVILSQDPLSLLALSGMRRNGIPDVNVDTYEAAVERLDMGADLSANLQPLMGEKDFKVTEKRLEESKKDRHSASKNVVKTGVIVLVILLIIVFVSVSSGVVHVSVWTEKEEKSSDPRLPEKPKKLFFIGQSSSLAAKEKQQDTSPTEDKQIEEAVDEEKKEEEDTDVFVGPGTARVHKSPLKQKDTAKASEKKQKRVRFIED
eukprot:gnl/TRDRNA2_/TRDRNA2_65791_c0_seq1.p1 gnl/TRDRNA2_/TRDRNA2_65791_c0~~gnl/TRDRNA2_/TRDRNA2_65791_c0_seq1.p1  ORF type:complete len:322 (+),score=84.21 gnl/TRDRNA2_/TRDRNA2_65791_c0_seq1:38-967(+)